MTLGLLLTFLCLSNCVPAAAPERSSPDLAIRNNSLALLAELLNDEKHVDKLLLIKRDSPELKRLVKDISETADDGARRLQKLMKRDPGIRADTDLPPGEQATRQ